MDSKARTKRRAEKLSDDSSSSSGITDFYKGFRPTKKPAPRRQDPGRRYHRGHIYDSETGITCHFCRQKTVDKRVICRKCASTFCGGCLWKRHGEDVEIETGGASDDCWVCPTCRGGCGPGCKDCCNCSICRQKRNLKPPKVTKSEMQARGFDNVHDYLIHLETKESPEQIRARKIGKRWCLSGDARSQSNYSKDAKKSWPMSSRAKESQGVLHASSSEDELSESKLSPLRSHEDMGRQEADRSKETQSSLQAHIPTAINTSKSSSNMIHSCEGYSGMIHTSKASSKMMTSPMRTLGMISSATKSNEAVNEAEDKKRTGGRVPLFFRSREEFNKKLQARLAEPYDSEEFKSLWDSVRCRKPVCDAIEAPQGGATTFCTKGPGQSFVDLHPDFAKKLTATREREEKLKLLRGFFFWLEHAGTEGAFKPWIENEDDEECLAVDGPDCKVLGVFVSVADDEDDPRTTDTACHLQPKREVTKRQPVDTFSHKNIVFNWDEEDIKPKLHGASSIIFNWDTEDAKPNPKETLPEASSLDPSKCVKKEHDA